MKEIWKDINGYEGYYQVSNTGKVRKINGNTYNYSKPKVFMLKQVDNGRGYMKVFLHRDNKCKQPLVHRLVAEAFIQNPEGKPHINHKDGIKTNNAVGNLEWCTRSENMLHAFKTGLAHAPAEGKFGSDNPKSIPVLMIDKETNTVVMRFGSLIDAAHYVGAEKSSHIVSCCKGRLRSSYGYKWRYA